MQVFLDKLQAVFTDRSLRNKIFFVFGALLLFRLLANVPIPGINPARLEAFLGGGAPFLGLLNLTSGGGLANFSIMMVGVMAFITASIIMQLMTVMSPKLKALLHEEGDIGRKKFYQYARLLTLPLAMIQAFGLLTLLHSKGIAPDFTAYETMVNVIVIGAGAILIMWIGELITEFGIGNGVSILIFAGIVAAIPGTVARLYVSGSTADIPLYLGFGIAAVLIVAGTTLITEAERPIPITYAKRARGGKSSSGISTYLPIRVNQAGVMPIIFGLSILLFPQLLAGFLTGIDSAIAQSVASGITTFFANGFLYSALYFVLVFAFTFFYKSIMFEPEQIAENLQKGGAFIPGVRPGATTADYIAAVSNRVTLVGAIFLSGIAVLPLAMQAVTGNASLAIGGTAILIVVSVVLDVIKKTDAQITMREY